PPSRSPPRPGSPSRSMRPTACGSPITRPSGSRRNCAGPKAEPSRALTRLKIRGDMRDVIVIGAGIVGLAVAREVLIRAPHTSVLVLEAADDVATGQSGHNSGVVHAGIYYPPGSLKAKLARAGTRAVED